MPEISHASRIGARREWTINAILALTVVASIAVATNIALPFL